MFVAVSYNVVVMFMNRFGVVSVVLVIMPCLAACVLDRFSIAGFVMLISRFSVIGCLIFCVITGKIILSVGFVGYMYFILYCSVEPSYGIQMFEVIK